MAVKFTVPIQKPNFYLLTGGPGAGKSTVIHLTPFKSRSNSDGAFFALGSTLLAD